MAIDPELVAYATVDGSVHAIALDGADQKLVLDAIERTVTDFF